MKRIMTTKTLNNLLATATLGLTILVGCTGASAQQAPAPQDDQESPPPVPYLPPEGEADAETVQLLQRIEQASNELHTLTSRLRYTRIQGLTGDQQRRFGDFYYTAQAGDEPTRFAVLFDRLVVDGRARPMQTWYVFDGNWLLERDQEDMTATRRQMVHEGAENSGVINMGEGQMPIPLRINASEVLENYHVTRLPDEELGETRTQVHLQLQPRNASEGDTPIHLWFESETLLLQKVVTNQDGDEIEMLFRDHTPNAEIEASVFDTALPNPPGEWQVQEVPLD